MKIGSQKSKEKGHTSEKAHKYECRHLTGSKRNGNWQEKNKMMEEQNGSSILKNVSRKKRKKRKEIEIKEIKSENVTFGGGVE